jgi:hypothetical protein
MGFFRSATIFRKRIHVLNFQRRGGWLGRPSQIIAWIAKIPFFGRRLRRLAQDLLGGKILG